MNILTQQGIQALKAGDKARATQLFDQALEQDPRDIQAWMWLSAAVDSDEERILCLEQVLLIDPNNSVAQRGLAKLRATARNAKPDTAPPFLSEQPDRLAGYQEENPVQSGQAFSIPGYQQPLQEPEPQPEIFLHRDSFYQPHNTSSPLHPANESSSDSSNEKVDRSDKNAGRRKTSKQGSNNSGFIISIGIFLAILLIGGGGIYYWATNVLLPSSRATQQAYYAHLTSAPTEIALLNTALAKTPSSTPVPTRTITLTPTSTPTRTPFPTATLVKPNATVVIQMDKIQKQVSDLRGIPIKSQVPSYLMANDRAETFVKNALLDEEEIANLENQQIVLSTLGLIKPTYDLLNNALNHIVDNIGGFYIPDRKQLFVLGIRFGGIEHYIYSHEYDHALVDQNFGMDKLGTSPDCIYDDQRCEAIDALIEGDAELLMDQWWRQYASPQDYVDIYYFRPPPQALPDEFAPPYAIEDLGFPYINGKTFVNHFYTKGNWAGVNKVYENPPLSTEQILHPEKYDKGEAPVPVAAPEILPSLGEGWQEIYNNSFGEWTTYLLLGFGADEAAQVKTGTARTAAAGWGGDHYQVYYNATDKTTALAANWIWDSLSDAQEFKNAMAFHLDELFRGGKIDSNNGECWSMNRQTTCLYTKDNQSLWIVAPDDVKLNAILSQYSTFP
jgi:hypothetical protein